MGQGVMNTPWRRFINQRTILLLSIIAFVVFFLQLREGRFSSGTEYESYDQYRLVNDRQCDITATDCNSAGEGIQLKLAFKGHPGALQAFPAQIAIDGLTHPEKAEVWLVFTMKGMDMGEQKQKLGYDIQSGHWLGNVILPLCTSGRSDWHVKVEVMVPKKIYLAEYEFMLVK